MSARFGIGTFLNFSLQMEGVENLEEILPVWGRRWVQFAG